VLDIISNKREEMLATLPKTSIITTPSIPIGQTRIYSLIREPLFKIDSSADGQGFERPPAEERKVFEEETFTSPQPEEISEISDLVFPPVEGIAGVVFRAQGEIQKSTATGTSSNIFNYIFIDTIRETSVKTAESDFVSLTRQAVIASSYMGLLVYSGYAASNTTFNYAPAETYETPVFDKTVTYEPSKPLYEARFPITVFSERVYQDKARGIEYAKPSAQPELHTYHAPIQETINIQPSGFYENDSFYQTTTLDLDLKAEPKPEYATPKLEVPLVDNKWVAPYADNEIKPDVPSLPVHHFIDTDLTATTTHPGQDLVTLTNYKLNPELKLPENIGFDDTLTRDRFIARLNEKVKAEENQAKSLDTRIDVFYTEIPAVTTTTAIAKDNAMELMGIVYQTDTKEKPKPEYRQDATFKEADLPDYRYNDFSVTLRESSFDFQFHQLGERHSQHEVVYVSQAIDLRYGVSEQPHGTSSLSLALEPLTDYQSNITDRSLLQNHGRVTTTSYLDHLVRIVYGDRREHTQSATGLDNQDLILEYAGFTLQQEPVTKEQDASREISPEQDLEKTVEQERELTEDRANENVRATNYNDSKTNTQEGLYGKSRLKAEETEINQPDDSSASYVAAVAVAAGLGLVGLGLAAISAPFSLLKKGAEGRADSEEEHLDGNKKLGEYTAREKSDSKPCYPIRPELEEIATEEYKNLVDEQNTTEKKFCYISPKINSVGEVFPGGLDFEITPEHLENLGRIGVRGNNRERFGGTYNIRKDTLGYQLWNLLVEMKGLVPYAKLNRDVKPFEQIDSGEPLFFDYLIGPHREFGESSPRFFVYDENGVFIRDTNLSTHLDPGKYKIRMFLEQQDPDYKPQYGETLEEINRERDLGTGRVSPNLYSLHNSNAQISEGVVALLDGAFVTDSSRVLDLADTGIKEGTLAAQWHKASIDVGMIPNYIRMDTIENGDQKGINALLVDSFDGAYEQYKKRYRNAKDELISTYLVKVNPRTGEIEREPGYGVEGIESKVQDGFVYVPLAAEQGVDFSNLRVNAEQLQQILRAKDMKLPNDPNSKYRCGGALRPLYNFLHQQNKELQFDRDAESDGARKAYVFKDVRILKPKDYGKTAKEILEQLFAKAEGAGNGMQRQYEVNPKTEQEELARISGYSDDALRRLDSGAKPELYINGVESPLATKINPGDRISLAYSVELPDTSGYAIPRAAPGLNETLLRYARAPKNSLN